MIGLKKNTDFSRVYRRGTSAADGYLVLYALKNDISCSRFGVSVSKKTGNSVIRHRIKRRLKEIYRLSEQEFKPGFDYVVIARSRAARADYTSLEQSLRRLMNKICLKDGWLLRFDSIRSTYPHTKDTDARIFQLVRNTELRRLKSTDRSRVVFLRCGEFCAAIRFRTEDMIRFPELTKRVFIQIYGI